MIARIKNISILLILISYLLSGCVGIRYLEKDQKILFDQRIKNGEKLDEYELNAQLTQEPNRRFPFLPIAPLVPVYQWGKNTYSKEKYEGKITKIEQKFQKKIEKSESDKRIEKLEEKRERKVKKQQTVIEQGNLLMRWGEPLVIYDSAKAEQSKNNLTTYLHAEGFFNGEVKIVKRDIERLVTLTFELNKKQPYLIDSIQYLIPDSAVLKLVKPGTLIKKGNRFRQVNFTRERDRINNLMVNNGYYGFSRQYISFNADSTTLGNNKMIVQIILRNPSNSENHKVFHLDSVVFVSDANTKYIAPRQQKVYNDVTYDYIRDIYSSKILDRRIFLEKGGLYREQDVFATQKQLSNTDNFKFVNIKYDTTGGIFMARIYTSPFKRYETSTEMGANLVEDSNKPGPFVNFRLKNRNPFDGLEIIELSANAGVDGLSGLSDQTTFYQSFEYGGRITFTFPQFLLPLGNKVKIGRYNPKTLVSARINFANRPEYERNTFSSAITYNWQKGSKLIFSFSPIDVNYINAKRISNEFQEIINDFGVSYAKSFESGFVSSSIFSVSIDPSSYGTANKATSLTRIFLETGGNLLNIFGDSIFGGDIAYYKYLKANVDFRRKIPINKNTSIATRISVGAAYPYGFGTASTLPYEKKFFLGGSSTLRAWQPRRVGPGSYTPIDETTGNISYNIEQPGDIIMQGNIEFRQRLIGIFSWATFLDAGNTWTWYTDENRPGSTFDVSRFASEIAVGTGLGVRFDFSFLLVRFDWGIKLFDPAQPSGDRFVLNKFRFLEKNRRDMSVLNTPVFNIGIGYPF